MCEQRMDKNAYFDALSAYSRNPSAEIPPILEQYLNGVAKNGETLFHWSLLKPLIVGKMEQVIGELKKGLASEVIPERPNVENVPFDTMRSRIMESLHKFNGAPFTIQRLCELLNDPRRHYKRSDKFLRGLEKNVLVVSTVDPFGRKIVCESGNKALVNGVDSVGSPFFTRDSSITSNLPPVPDWVTTAVSVASATQGSQSVDPKEALTSNEEASVSANGSLCGDQTEQPLALQTEEVVEETVVTTDTSENSSLATDGREPVTEDDEEESSGGDDTNASSSSSSSSEELSVSETSENADVTTAVTGTSEGQRSPWASVVSDGENMRHSSPVSTDINTTDTTEQSLETSPSTTADLPADKIDFQKNNEDEQADINVELSSTELSKETSIQLNSLNDSTGFETALSSEHNENSADTFHDPLQDSPVKNSLVRGESDSCEPSSNFVRASSDSTAASEMIKAEELPSCQQSCEVDSSSPEMPCQDITPMDTRNDHKSEATVVGPFDSTGTTSSLQLPASPPSQLYQPTTLHGKRPDHASPSADSPSEEPQAKRRKLSDDVEPAISKTSNDVTTSSSTSDFSSSPDVAGNAVDTTSAFDNPADQNTEVQEATEAASSGQTELVSSSSAALEEHKNISSPPSQLSSSSDSQGFDVVGDALSSSDKQSAEEKVQSQETLILPESLTPE